jgi:hypothetical protein
LCLTTYISANLSDCKTGHAQGSTFSQGENANLIENETELRVHSRTSIGKCKWRIGFWSRPKVVWTPTSVELTVMAGEYGFDVGYTTSPKVNECGPYIITMDLGE